MNQRGQATILIGIIFQIVFVFFAMVINVGLLVNDKINLQNSVDIAAYYAAMKQAETLTAMSHVNYQIRQAWKLLNWRIWALGDASRIQMVDLGSGSEHAATWGDKEQGPIVCNRNPFWYDEYKHHIQDVCKTLVRTVPPLKVVKFGPFQSSGLYSGFLEIFKRQSKRNSRAFSADCEAGGAASYELAVLVMESFKKTVAARRAVMQTLETQMTMPDPQDLAGQSVKRTAENVFMKNLTLANKDGNPQVTFTNSLAGHPFLVPIEVRLFIRYADIYGPGEGACVGEPKDLNEKPRAPYDAIFGQYVDADTAIDYYGKNLTTAEAFAVEGNAAANPASLVGFEKNPWQLAYVKVTATANPKMLFSPIGTREVKLSAEAYAMPFGGRIGPWYYDTWFFGQPQSTGGPDNKIDSRLPPRIGDPTQGDSIVPVNFPPNYSRFPGDGLGMKSNLARTVGLQAILGSGIDDLPHFRDDDYANLIDSIDDPTQDPVVVSKSKGDNSVIRTAELAALAPDLFDAVYYGIDSNFNETMGKKGLPGFFQSTCGGRCQDLGSTKMPNGGQAKPFSVAAQVDAKNKKPSYNSAFWTLSLADHLRTGWTQIGTDVYSDTKLVGQPVFNGSRIGYSVKLVSEKFLQSELPLGGKAPPAKALNAP